MEMGPWNKQTKMYIKIKESVLTVNSEPRAGCCWHRPIASGVAEKKNDLKIIWTEDWLWILCSLTCASSTGCAEVRWLYTLLSKMGHFWKWKQVLSDHVWTAGIVVQLLSRVWPFVTPWTVARQASLSFTISLSLLKLLSVESIMPSSHLILCRLLLLLPSIFASIRVFSNELALRIRWPKYWSFSLAAIRWKDGRRK